MDEKALQPEQWEPLAAAPIIPGVSHGPNPAPPFPTQQLGNYFISPLTSDIQHDGLFVRTGYQTFGAPRIPLMPLSPAGNAQNNVVNETIVQSSSGGSVFTITGLVFSGTWNSFTNYVANDVVLSSGALYVASSSSTNQTPASSPAFWTQLAGTGSVTSVALTMPSIFSVAGSPILTSGTLAVTLATEVANKVFAGPTTGPDAAPTFRLLVAGDIPNLDAAKITTGTLAPSRWVVASANRTAQVANVAATTLFAVVTAGLYRVTVFTIISQAASVSSTLPDSQIIYTDEDSAATITIAATASSAGNTTSTLVQTTLVVNAKASTNIQYAIGQLNPYASSGGTAMQFAYRARLEFLG